MVEHKLVEHNETGKAPTVVGGTKVNVAFPFAQIRVEEPTADLKGLAAIVEDLAAVVGDLSPGERTDDLRRRAQALSLHLQ